MKGFPRWFSPPSRPIAPRKPIRTFQTTETVYSGELLTKDSFLSLVNDWAGEEYSWRFSSYERYGDTEIHVEVTRYIQVPNERYDEQVVSHKEDYKEYRAKLAEWKPLKARWDELEKAKQAERDRKQLERLKKRLGEA